MHSFLKSIGYSEINHQSQVEELIAKTIGEAESYSKYEREDGTKYVEFSRKVCPMAGIKVFGEEDVNGVFHFGSWTPFGSGFDNIVNSEEEIYVNKRVDSESYTGMCDDNRLGISLIFYVTNPVEYLGMYNGEKVLYEKAVQFTALAQTGKIILPTLMRVENNDRVRQENNKKNKLIAEAKKGNQEAIENLTIEDIDRYAMVTQRIKNEDILSIVDTSIVPYGSESDMYCITGIIDAVMQEENKDTKEKIWHLIVHCNEIPMDVFVNENDLLGEPAAGRRFRGNVWLQGKLIDLKG